MASELRNGRARTIQCVARREADLLSVGRGVQRSSAFWLARSKSRSAVLTRVT
jgi:hypothetical protein